MCSQSISSLSFIFFACVLSGCSILIPKDDPTRFFALKATSTGTISPKPKLGVGVGPVTIPGYLDHKEIVTAGPSNDLILADYYVWAEPVDRAVTRVLAKNISRLLKSPTVVPFPDTDTQYKYRTTVVIRRFEMGADGKVHLEASYSIEGGPGSNIIGSSRSRTITTGVSQPDDYAMVVDAMSRALSELSRSIARDLVKLDHD